MGGRISPEPKEAKHRVSKACDRCRLKKSKCDGQSPCSRCKAENQICMFGERRRSKDKTYPKGYVELLEYQQTVLVRALQQMYAKSCSGTSSAGTEENMPIHSILDRLGLLPLHCEGNYHPSTPSEYHFEEDTNRMQENLREANPAHDGEMSDSPAQSARSSVYTSSLPSLIMDSPQFDSCMLNDSLSASPQDWAAVADSMQFFDSPAPFDLPDPLFNPAPTVDSQTAAAIDYLRRLRKPVYNDMAKGAYDAMPATFDASAMFDGFVDIDMSLESLCTFPGLDSR